MVAGSTELHREAVDVQALLMRITHRYGFGDVPVEISPRLPDLVRLDKVRFERIELLQ